MNPRVIAFSALILVSCLALTLTQAVQAVQLQRKPRNQTPQNLEIPLADDAVIRFKKPPKQYDDNGKQITPTEAQLKELKGDPKLPGYKAEISDLKPGQVLEVRLSRPKKTTSNGLGDKPPWKTVATITARVARSNDRRRGGGMADTQTSQKLTLEPDTSALIDAGLTVTRAQRSLTLDSDIYATRVMIVTDVQTDTRKGR